MEKNGYVENPNFKATPENGYWCANCEYFTQEPKSPTGYWCKKLSFPDRQNGCCNLWELAPK